MEEDFNMGRKRANVLAIGGFDPCAGAGILADVKTMEQIKVMAMAVNTANTVQTEDQFKAVNWIEEDIVLDQLSALLDAYLFTYAKIGLIKSLSFLCKAL